MKLKGPLREVSLEGKDRRFDFNAMLLCVVCIYLTCLSVAVCEEFGNCSQIYFLISVQLI